MKSYNIMTGALASAAWMLAGTGCNNVSTSVLVQDVVDASNLQAIEMALNTGMPPPPCSFQADASPSRFTTVLNTENAQLNVALRAEVRNVMSSEPVPVQEEPEQELVPPNQVSPVRFDFRWECESNGFTGNLGAFFLPQFSLEQPFCLNERDEAAEFVGFDAVPASGPAVPPGELGLVSFEPVTPQLGLAFDEFFQLASFASACCQQVGGDCEDVGSAMLQPGTACARLDELFQAVSGDALSAQRPDDVTRWLPYAIYDGNTPPVVQTAAFPLRLRGRFEFVTGSGDMVTSNDLLHIVNLCRGCSLSTTVCTAL